MNYDRNNHSKYLLMYHIIFVCKYRRNALIGFEDSLKDISITIASKSDFEVVEMECDKDHIYIF